MGNEIGRKLEGKTALITGASRGIGRAVARAYGDQGASVFICARKNDDVLASVAELAARGANAAGVAGDVGKAQDAARIVQNASERFGRIDILVNNASVLGPRTAIAGYPVAAWQEVMRINLTGPFLMAQEILQRMLPQRQGVIINVSSGVGKVGRADWGAYAVSKFGLEGLTQVLADELRESGIRVNAVNPGPTRTAMRSEAYPDEEPQSLPEPAAIVPVFLYLASDESLGVSGQTLEARDWVPRGN